ncbi:hypothetical protein NARC_10294 [Candidatus Nitrosocosmicus arcticus]|uniref:Uncharacterized protein n=1 Tax=Candidatus Nitrosocosmicus arcticus TaxID=2035267 RepID=A0A557SZ51_9ARCH|nr:hypothetical protein NARC_10294 [Candidatus Nitrosocosmicus arcticus]
MKIHVFTNTLILNQERESKIGQIIKKEYFLIKYLGSFKDCSFYSFMADLITNVILFIN